MRPTKAIIHLDNLVHNINEIKKRLDTNVKICLAVKADAYGHGAVQCSVAALRAGVTHLAVASVQEGIELRNAGIIAPIISLSIPSIDEVQDIIVHDISPIVADEEYIEHLNDVAMKMECCVDVHLKIDTGMGRIGCTPNEAPLLAKKICDASNVHLAGVATHFASSDSTKDEDIAFTHLQLDTFKKAIKKIEQAGINIPLVHAAASGATLLQTEHFDMVRVGLLAYGYSALEEEAVHFKPVMELITKVVFIKKILKGESISYGRTWVSDKDTEIATLPIGYADGLPRLLSSKLKVRIGDAFYPIVGRICMDQCMVDVGAEHRVNRWDEVCVFGPAPNDLLQDGRQGISLKNNSAKDLATLCGTIPYEITSNINKRVPRVYEGNIA